MQSLEFATMESTIVIKVKYGERLRRFTASVYGGELALDISGLTYKIIDLFNLHPDAELMLTYVDEDGDTVSLVDDLDIYDVMRQSLNPVRITVTLNTEKGVRSYGRSNGISTPVSSFQIGHPVPNLNAAPDSALPSEAATSAPGVSQLVEPVSKMKESDVNPATVSKNAGESSSEPSFADNQDRDNAKVNNGVGVSVTADPSSSKMKATLNDDPPFPLEYSDYYYDQGPEQLSRYPLSYGYGINLSGDQSLNGKAVCSESPNDSLLGHFYGSGGGYLFGDHSLKGKAVCSESQNDKYHDLRGRLNSFGASTSSDNARQRNFDTQTNGMSGGLNYHSCFESHAGLNIVDENDPAPQIQTYGTGAVFHAGIRCDACGTFPIFGPRYVSKLKKDYDLCFICYLSYVGSGTDFFRMEHPLSDSPWWTCNGVSDHRTMVFPPTPPHDLREWGMKAKRNELDSRFITDVNMVDGTLIAPSTPFTKYWRMLNNGRNIWPRGTSLVWVGGEKLSGTVCADTKVYVDGVPPDNEMVVGVDFTSPEQPGEYISYWRMCSPAGKPFGERIWVWVLVRVQVQVNQPDDGVNRLINLNLAPENEEIMTSPVVTNAAVDLLSGPGNPSKAEEEVKPIVDDEQHAAHNGLELNYPKVDTTTVVFGDSVAPTPVVVTSAPSSSEAVKEPKSSSHGVSDIYGVDQSYFQKMGFKTVVDFNKKVSNLNDYILQETKLCGRVADWNPILVELQEMGFCDKEVNKMLIKKNNGSIKRVVMDLITAEKKAVQKKDA